MSRHPYLHPPMPFDNDTSTAGNVCQHTKKGTFLSYIVTAKYAEKVLDFEACGLLIPGSNHTTPATGNRLYL